MSNFFLRNSTCFPARWWAWLLGWVLSKQSGYGSQQSKLHRAPTIPTETLEWQVQNLPSAPSTASLVRPPSPSNWTPLQPHWPSYFHAGFLLSPPIHVHFIRGSQSDLSNLGMRFLLLLCLKFFRKFPWLLGLKPKLFSRLKRLCTICILPISQSHHEPSAPHTQPYRQECTLHPQFWKLSAGAPTPPWSAKITWTHHELYFLSRTPQPPHELSFRWCTLTRHSKRALL